MSVKQRQLILEWIQEHGYIVPAKMAGKVWRGGMFGSETTKRCREMRIAGLLQSTKDPEDPKFTRFYKVENKQSLFV